ncbi:MAG: hypothetical protein CUN55_17215, partial [Phototrophicales bacterium]
MQPGDVVSAGTVLVEYSVADLKAQLDQALENLSSLEEIIEPSVDDSAIIADAQFALATARLNLQQALDSVPIGGAGVTIAQAYDALEQAKRNYNNVIGNPTNPPQTIEAAYDAIRTAERNLEAANVGGATEGQAIELHKYVILNAENEVIRAEIAYEEALKAVATGGGSSEENTVLNEARALVDELNTAIAQSSISAPFDGV